MPPVATHPYGRPLAAQRRHLNHAVATLANGIGHRDQGIRRPVPRRVRPHDGPFDILVQPRQDPRFLDPFRTRDDQHHDRIFDLFAATERMPGCDGSAIRGQVHRRHQSEIDLAAVQGIPGRIQGAQPRHFLGRKRESGPRRIQLDAEPVGDDIGHRSYHMLGSEGRGEFVRRAGAACTVNGPPAQPPAGDAPIGGHARVHAHPVSIR